MLSSSPSRCAAVALLIAMSAAGCTPEAHRYIRFPRLFGPGPAPYQRAEAIQHDPYPLNDVGPAIEGGRPREYQQPVNEVERARMAAPRTIGLAPLAQPTYTVAPPTMVAPPVMTNSPVMTSPPIITTPPATTVPAPPLPTTSPYQIQPRSPY